MRKLGLVLLLVSLSLAACGDQEETPVLTIPSEAQGADAETQPASETQPAATPVPSRELPTPAIIAPTATVAATSAPEEATPESSPVVILRSGADFGDDRNPLTGELMADPSVLDRRPLAIKISNAPARFVRPQHGLNDADLVFEHVAEGGITRFTLIVYGKTPDDVGPIRSARLIDLELPAMYDAALAFSGASVGVSRRLYASDFEERILGSTEPGYYRTGADKPFEHTLFGNPVTFWSALSDKGLNTRPNFTSFMSFSEEAPEGGQPANEVNINFDWENVFWFYDQVSGRYLRWASGERHLDGNSGEQVRTTNVVVIIANHVLDPTICEEIRDGTCAHLSVQAQIWNSGPAIIFRDGQRYDVTWHRLNRSDMFTFTDASGQPFPLQIGNSWFEVMPTWYGNPVTVES